MAAKFRIPRRREPMILLLLLVSARFAFAQSEGLPPAPIPVVAGESPTAPILGRPVAVPTTNSGQTNAGQTSPIATAPIARVPAIVPAPVATPVPPAPQPSALIYAPPPPPPPTPGPFAPVTDPGYMGWGPYSGSSSPPGLFVNLELDLLFPAIKFKLANEVPTPVTGQILNVPSTGLDFTVAPIVEVGYRLPESTGLFAFNYGFLNSEGTGTGPLNGLPADVRTRLVINSWGLDYGSSPFEPAPRYNVNYRLGIRMADVFFDSRAISSAQTQQASNSFFGAGPHGRVDIERRIVLIPGLRVFGRADGSLLIGQIDQRFNVETPLLGGRKLVEMTSNRGTQAVPVLNLQFGLNYTPAFWENVTLSGGYMFEEYFNVGRLGLQGAGTTSYSRGSVYSQGLFFRGQIDF